MPTYEYECSQCGHKFELFQSMTAEPVKDCPNEQCGGKGTVRRLIGAGAGLIFKGSGFYCTDYGKGSAVTSGKSESKKAAEGGSSCASCCPHAKDGSCSSSS